jgi:hypothetical protein
MAELIPFAQRLRQILWNRKISLLQFSIDTGIDRRIFYRKRRKHHRTMYMAIAYYLNMTVEELIEGTTAMDEWYC